MFNAVLRLALSATLVSPALAFAELDRGLVEKLSTLELTRAYEKEIETANGTAFSFAYDLADVYWNGGERAVIREAVLDYQFHPAEMRAEAEKRLNRAVADLLERASKEHSYGYYKGGCVNDQYIWGTNTHCWDDSELIKVERADEKGTYLEKIAPMIQPVWPWEKLRRQPFATDLEWNLVVAHNQPGHFAPTELVIFAKGRAPDRNAFDVKALEQIGRAEYRFAGVYYVFDLLSGEITLRPFAARDCVFAVTEKGDPLGCAATQVNGVPNKTGAPAQNLELDGTGLTGEEALVLDGLLLN